MEKRVRSPNYPALSLPEAVQKVAAVHKAIHNHLAGRESVAKAMGYAGLNGASATAVSALHKYGLLEKSGEDVKVSERAMRILHPHSPAERAAALRDASKNPALFAELAERFPGRYPNEDVLRNYLVRQGFAPAALSAVISAYRETSEMVERDGGAYDSPASNAEEPSAMQQAQPTPAAAPVSAHHHVPFAHLAEPVERAIGRYDFEGGAYVRIAASGDIDTQEALDMIDTLVKLKRAELTRSEKRRSSPANSTTGSEPEE